MAASLEMLSVQPNVHNELLFKAIFCHRC